MGCVQGKAQKRIADYQKLSTSKSLEVRALAKARKIKKGRKNLFTIVEVPVSHEESHDLALSSN